MQQIIIIMDITLNVPVSIPNSAFSLVELRNALEEYAKLWVSKARAKESQKTKDLELPEEFEKLCGSISQDKLESLSASDERIAHLLS